MVFRVNLLLLVLSILSAMSKRTTSATDVLDERNMPKKKFFRTRAHCNPLSHNDGFAYPVSSDKFDWSSYYPNLKEEDRLVRHLDIGMGFGGLTISLAELFPDKPVLGMEIRAKVSCRCVVCCVINACVGVRVCAIENSCFERRKPWSL